MVIFSERIFVGVEAIFFLLAIVGFLIGSALLELYVDILALLLLKLINNKQIITKFMKIKFLKCLITILTCTISLNIGFSYSYADDLKKNYKHDSSHSSSPKNQQNNSKQSDYTNQELNSTLNSHETEFNQNKKNFNHKLIIIEDKNKNLIDLNIAIADNAEKRTKGLMEVKNLSEDNAMLFIFDTPQVANFWMKNTAIPLDIIFVDKSNKIVHIHKNAKPFDETLISSQKEVDKAIEVNAGLVNKYNIKVGNKIKFK